MTPITWQERNQLDSAAAWLSRCVEMRNMAQDVTDVAQRVLVDLCRQYGVPYEIRSNGSVRVPEGWPQVRRPEQQEVH
jgi:hypothetical protein